MHIVVLISAIQQGDSVIHTFNTFFLVFSLMAYLKILNVVLCAIEESSLNQ